MSRFSCSAIKACSFSGRFFLQQSVSLPLRAVLPFTSLLVQSRMVPPTESVAQNSTQLFATRSLSFICRPVSFLKTSSGQDKVTLNYLLMD